MTRVTLTGWREGLHKVALIKELRTAPDIGLATVKSMVDDPLDGKSVTAGFSTEEAALAFLERVRDFGAEAHQD